MINLLILIIFGLVAVSLIYSCLVVGSRYDEMLYKSTKNTSNETQDND